jgi:hypothetical protein
MSWKLEVQTDDTGKWYSNALRFETKEQAEWSAIVLAEHWVVVRSWRVISCNKPSNAACNEYGKHQLFPETKEHVNER